MCQQQLINHWWKRLPTQASSPGCMDPQTIEQKTRLTTSALQDGSEEGCKMWGLYERGRCCVWPPAITCKSETQANETHKQKQYRSWQTLQHHHASKQRKRKISNWNLDTVSQPSENSKNEDDNDAIEENSFPDQKNQYKQANNRSIRRSQAEQHHSTVW